MSASVGVSEDADVRIFAFSEDPMAVPPGTIVDSELASNLALARIRPLEYLVHRIINHPKGPILVGRAYLNTRYDGFHTRMRLTEDITDYQYESEKVGSGYVYKDDSTKTVYFVESVDIPPSEEQGDRGESEATQFVQSHLLKDWAVNYSIVYKNFNGAEYKPRTEILALINAAKC
ncbi:hypothetical protein CHUAL_005165 [Chamberlinius hualienensis]